MDLSRYIDYWDQTIAGILSNPTASSLPSMFGVNVQTDFIPEPYMGDPNNCSFVIVNLNPGSGQCHSCIKQKDVSEMLVNKVKTEGYSTAIRDFPYLMEGKAVGLTNWDNNPGRKWWKSKERWIKHILNVFIPSYDYRKPIPEGYFPFAMELFSWHTERWPSFLNKKMEKNGVYGQIINDNVIEPLYEAIKKSKFHVAFCVGKPIGTIISSFSTFTRVNPSPITPSIKNGKRSYDVYHDGNGCYIINTWAQGGNTYPSDMYEKEEERIVSKFIRN